MSSMTWKRDGLPPEPSTGPLRKVVRLETRQLYIGGTRTTAWLECGHRSRSWGVVPATAMTRRQRCDYCEVES